VAEVPKIHHVCLHCGAENARTLGWCSVCNRAVCEHCGNIQFSSGARKAVHSDCLKDHSQDFKMIRFVD